VRFCITGANGFLGRFVVNEALALGHSLDAVVRSTAAAETVAKLGAEPVAGDLDDPASVDDAFTEAAARGARGLINLASLGFGHAPLIVSAAEETGFSRAVFISTTAVTTTLPVASKRVRLEGEETVRTSALDWTILRPTMIYGAPGDRNIERLLALLRRSPVIPLPGGGERLQQPVHVADVARAVIAAILRPDSIGRVYDIAGPTPLTFRQLISEAATALGRRRYLLPMPLRPAVTALRLYERAAPRPRLKAEQLERLAEDKVFDIAAAARDLGFSPRSFATGVRDEVAALWT